MVDLVATCPKDFWAEWIAEGDAAGEPESGQDWGWYTRHSFIRRIRPGDRLYVVAHGRLRGYAPVTHVTSGAIFRRGGAVPVTMDTPVPGFRGLRMRWWDRADERPFPDWMIGSVPAQQADLISRRESRKRRLAAILGSGQICHRCGGTLYSYHLRCDADLTARCPGFVAVDAAIQRLTETAS